MFDDLRAAFRQAVENFNKELGSTRITDQVDGLVQGMTEEVARVRVQLRELEGEIERAEKEIARERGAAATCKRREQLARAVPDPETEAIARKHASRHEERADLLRRKSEALQAELDHRRREMDEMLTQLKEARARRDSLAATAGRTKAHETFSSGDDLFGELDRMADRIETDENAADINKNWSSEPTRPRRPEPDYDARLAELKRRMGR